MSLLKDEDYHRYPSGNPFKDKLILIHFFLVKWRPLNRPSIFAYFFPSNYLLKLSMHYPISIMQASSIRSLKEIKSFFESKNIQFFLMHGSLLGAIRSNSFAGRPGDIDFGIQDVDMNKLLDYQSELSQLGFKITKVKCNIGALLITPTRGCPISLIVFRSLTKNKQVTLQNTQSLVRYYDFFSSDVIGKIQGRPFLSYKELTENGREKFDNLKPQLNKQSKAQIFGISFSVPANAKNLLTTQYGSNWETPSGKQYD